MMSVLAVGMSIAASMGLSQMFNWPYTPVHTVLPFVLLGLGVDDSFVIMNSYRQSNPDDPIAKRMKESMSHAGVSITVTSMTDFVAFIISTSTSLPALASFCFYAATGILFLFLFQCIFFGAYIVIDDRRQAARRMDCCCCFKVAENSGEEERGARSKEQGARNKAANSVPNVADNTIFKHEYLLARLAFPLSNPIPIYPSPQNSTRKGTPSRRAPAPFLTS